MHGGRLPENGSTGDLFLPSKLVNRTFQSLLRLENALFLRGMNWPVGVSLMVLARKPVN
jgi:hypothetical protein